MKLLEMIWGIISDIVAIGHGMHPVQQTDCCGQNGKTLDPDKSGDSDLLESEKRNSLAADYCAAITEEESTHA